MGPTCTGLSGLIVKKNQYGRRAEKGSEKVKGEE